MTSQMQQHQHSAVMRALSHVKDSQVVIKQGNQPGHRLVSHQLTISQTHTDDVTTAQRGIVDSSAYFLKFHNPALHQQCYQHLSDPRSKALADAAELARIESIAARDLPGIAHNIADKINYDTQLTNQPDIDLSVRALITHLCTGIEIPNTLVPGVNQLRAPIASYADAILENLDNQQLFSNVINDIITLLEDQQSTHNDEESQEDQSEQHSANNQQHDEQETTSHDDTLSPVTSFEETTNANATQSTQQNTSQNTATSDHDLLESKQHNLYDGSRDIAVNYHVYTHSHDQIIDANSLCTHKELVRLRHTLDDRLARLPSIPKKHVYQLIRTLMAAEQFSWSYNLEEGFLDSARLSMRIAQQDYPYFYKQRQTSAHHNTVISLLLDNSGSMRGRPITLAAMSAELLAKTLELCGIKIEILGFTTATWKGGQSRIDWQEAGSPPMPGRLNDLRHIIYKHADIPWRKSRNNIGLMLKEGILKENIDGEAILWAHKRLLNRPEKRKILMVISDGAAVDDSTLSANHPNYLDDHLHQVIHSIQQKGNTELVAIGIGHDVTRYYSQAVTIKDADELTSTMFDQLSTLFSTNPNSMAYSHA